MSHFTQIIASDGGIMQFWGGVGGSIVVRDLASIMFIQNCKSFLLKGRSALDYLGVPFTQVSQPLCIGYCLKFMCN